MELRDTVIRLQMAQEETVAARQEVLEAKRESQDVRANLELEVQNTELVQGKLTKVRVRSYTQYFAVSAVISNV